MSLCETHFPPNESHQIGADTHEKLVTASACQALSRLSIWMVGVSEARAGFRFVRHRPREWQVLTSIGGHGDIWADGRWCRCEPGQAYLTPSQVPHAYRAPAGETWRVCWVIYATPPPGIAPLTQPRLISADAATLLHAVNPSTAEITGNANGHLADDWARLIDGCARRLVGQSNPLRQDAPGLRLREIWDAVERDLAHPWDNRELARRACLSVEHLRRLSHSQVGHSPIRHVTYLRMRYAAALLESGAYTVAAVAALVGYENPFAFSVAFKRQWGVSPTEWRASQSG